jgi:hypothetical protein
MVEVALAGVCVMVATVLIACALDHWARGIVESIENGEEWRDEDE